MTAPGPVVPEALRKSLRPRRSIAGTAAWPSAASIARLWKRIETAYSGKHPFGGKATHASIYAAGLRTKVEPALGGVRRAAHALLSSPSADGVASAPIDVLAAAEEMLVRAEHELSLIDAVIVSRGLADGLAMALRTMGFGLGADGGYTTAVYVVSSTRAEIPWGEGRWLRLRSAVCAATQADHDAAVSVARALLPELDPVRRVAVACAFPDQPWANEELASCAIERRTRDDLLLSAATSARAVKAYVAAAGDRVNLAPYALDLVQVVPEAELLPVLEGALPALLVKPKYGPLLKTPPRMIADAIACWRSPAAAAALARYASHPVLAPTVLGYFRDAPELGAALEAAGSAKLAPTIERVLGKAPRPAAAAVADAATIPALLRERPWRSRSGKAPPRASLALAMHAAEERVELARHVADFETSSRVVIRDMTASELSAWRASVAAGAYACADYASCYAQTPPRHEYARVPTDEGIAAWNEGKCGLAQSPLQWVARHGVRVLPGFVARDWLKWLAWEPDDAHLEAVTSFVSPRVAPDIARAAERKRARRVALAWLARHAAVAATGLVPAALGCDGEAQRAAERALVALEQTGHREDVRRAAAAYGPDAARLVDALLARDPLALEVAPPKPPSFLRVAELSDVTLRADSSLSIGEAPRAALVEMLQVSPPDVPYAGLARVRDACSEESLGRLARDLLEQWVLGDLPGRHDWMLFACVWFPSEAATRRIVALAREWARKNGPKATRLCAALAAIGSDAALLTLAHVAETTRYETLKQDAQAFVDEIAALRGLSADELGDRTVPDVGLDAAGTMTLSYGKRTFVVSLDETLRPVVRDAGGFVGRSLPRVTKADDPVLAKAARERFEALATDVAAVAQRQLRRLERAMVDGRAWRADDFRARIAEQPLLVHVARRLVWETVPDRGEPVAFRIAEDGSFADARDRPFAPGDAPVCIAHPARTKDIASTWARLFADYEIVQPFPQIGREVFAIEPGEGDRTSLARTAGISVAPAKMLGVLESRGWRRDAAGDVTAFTRAVRDRRGAPLVARLPLSPGFAIAELRHAPDVTTGALELETPDRAPAALSALSALVFSELLCDALALSRSSGS